LSGFCLLISSFCSIISSFYKTPSIVKLGGFR
jgi:hypothetical protein